MKPCSAQLLLVWPFFVILSLLLPLACADIDSDRKALLSFAADVPHGPKLDWSNATDMCISWSGVTCNSDGTRVLTVRLPASGLTGPIPSNTLGELDALRVLSLRSNRLNGTLPPDLLSLPSLRSLFLQHNNFTGNIPALFPRRLHILDLSFNSFTGNIPATIQYLTRLTGFYLQNNSISGPIPNVTFSKLKHVNMSYNNLNGSIPSSLGSFPYSSFTGNHFLCGLPLKPCPLHPPSSPPTSKRKFPFPFPFPLWAIIVIAIGGCVAALLLVALFVFCFLKNKTSDESRFTFTGENPTAELALESENNKLFFFQGCGYNFDIDDLLRASAEVLGKGSFGTAYKAVLEESMTVAVKRLKEVGVARSEFEQQMEIIGRVGQHPNVVPLRAYYYSKDEKLLVYDYFEGGSLMNLLHGNNGSGRMPLDWETRVKIILGTARGIAHIHSIGFSHGNIKASNVLINQDMDGCISDIGLPPLMNTTPSSCSSSSSAGGYRAPEVVETPQKYSHKSDVYSFGILLLEMLTAKQPIQSPVREGMVVDLPRWVQSIVREEWSAEVFDVDLMRRFHDIEDEMVQILQIGLACVVRVPDNRPTIHQVVRMIEQARLYDFENRPPSD